MLVVSRKQGESIIIGENIELKILEISEGSVRIGIEAPKSIRVLRKELIKEVENENRESINNLESIINKLK